MDSHSNPLEAINTRTTTKMEVLESIESYTSNKVMRKPDNSLSGSPDYNALANIDTHSSVGPCEMIELVNIQDLQSGNVNLIEVVADHNNLDTLVTNNLLTNMTGMDKMELVDIQGTTKDMQTNSDPIAIINVSNCETVCVGKKYINDVYTQKEVRDISLRKYVWKAAIKNSSKIERISCAVVFFAVMFCLSVVVYYFLHVVPRGIDKDSDEWYITRDMWLAAPAPVNRTIALKYEPIKLVVVQHSMSEECKDYTQCSLSVKDIQRDYLLYYNSDIPYNFLVGSDGRVYEGRGWGIQSVSSRWLNLCLISIGFIGNYAHIAPTDLQLNRTKMLLEEGVREGHLDRDYSIVGALDILPTESPGENLYAAIQEFDHYEYDSQYHHMSCEQIHATDNEPFVDEAPHEWFISREDWTAEPYDYFNTTDRFNPLKLVVIDDYATRDCYVFNVCRSQLLNLQAYFWLKDTEIPYNFMIGNDGRVYETTGWGIEPGNELFQFQPCAVFIGFFGDYTDSKTLNEARVNEAQVNRTHILLEEGVSNGFLHQDYMLVGINDILVNGYLGQYLYDEIKTWTHYDSFGLTRDITCDML